MTPILRKMTSRTHDCANRTKPGVRPRDRNRPMKIQHKNNKHGCICSV